MRKKVRLIVLLIVVIIVILGISQLLKNNENGNIANMGLACEAKGTIYYNKYEKGIFSIKNGKETRLTEETAYSLNIVGNKIYYITVADFNNVVIKSVDLDGKNLTNIATIYTSISKIFVDKKFIFYATNETGKGIAKIDLNGENEQIILAENVQDFWVKQNKIYFVNQSNQICKVDSSGENNRVLSEEVSARKIQVIGKWIYYYHPNENALFRLKNDGKKNELVSTLIHNETYNISGKYVYYFDRENSKIARMKIGKSNQCDELVNLNVSNTKINIVNDQIYYLDKAQNSSQTYLIYRIKTNGKSAKPIEY